ncbi:MAG: hypothetical protein ACR2PH_17895 [Desulfobulbia bacterium]
MEYLQQTREYQLIADYYGTRTAERSGVELMQHIIEGLAILKAQDASMVTMKAYCIHPLLQGDTEYFTNFHSIFNNADPDSIMLAVEYRRCANAYLCKPHTDDWYDDWPTKEGVVNLVCKEVALMLLADKVQNMKDFMLYHYHTHERADELLRYFAAWIDLVNELLPSLPSYRTLIKDSQPL